MKRNKYSAIAPITLLSFLVACTSLSPSKFLEKFPSETNSKFYGQPDGNKAIMENKCKLLVEGRKYIAPIGFTIGNDMQHAAKGIDEWVKADGGNSYILNNYEWISVGNDGATQLIVYFDTLLCEL